MHPREVTVEHLRSIAYRQQSTFNGPTIDGVRAKTLTTHLDGRGEVTELWSAPWIEREGYVRCEHAYQSATDFGVVKCWHLHALHTDQFTVTRGKVQVVCVDIREGSPTFGVLNSFVFGTHHPMILLIPPGVLHGWKALSQPEIIVVNFQSMPYDPSDEFKFPWDCVLSDVWEPKNG